MGLFIGKELDTLSVKVLIVNWKVTIGYTWLCGSIYWETSITK